MEKTVHPTSKRAQNSLEPSSALSRQPSGSVPQAGHLAQLTKLANQSPQVQAQLKRAEDIHGSPKVEGQRSLAAGINAGAPMAQFKREEKKPMQPKIDDKKLKQPKFDDTAQAARKEKPKQPKYADGGAPAQFELGPSANRTGLPDNLKSGVESLSGVSLDSVKVHYNSPKPAQLNALAYAQGTDIHVAPGQQKHLPHEAWHVAQQSQGRVKPTTQAKGVNINDDSSLEREADVMGAKAATVQAADKRKKQ